MTRLRKAGKATLVTQIFNWTGLALSLLTVPLYLHWLGQERYGLLLTGLAFAGYLMFSDAGLNWASMILIAQANGRGDHAAIASIIRNSFSLAACSAAVVALVVGSLYWALQSRFIPFLPNHPEFPGLMLAIGASVVGNLALSPFYNLFAGLQESHLAAVYQGGGRLVGTVLAVVIASTGASLGWVFGANVAGALTAGLLAALHCCRRHRWAFQTGSFWERTQIRQQLRTGAKSLAMQVGNVLWGTAPVLAISSMAGPQFVPYFSIPMTLLNAPLSVMWSFSASLQAGYGEAFGRGEHEWVAHTLQTILRQTITVLGLLGCGFLLLASPFARMWTGGEIDLEPLMLLNVLIIAGVGALLSVFRFAITGINRHRIAGFSDFFCGVFAIVFALLAVKYLGFDWVWTGVLLAALLTSAWILPRELSRALQIENLLPPVSFWGRWCIISTITAICGWVAFMACTALPDWLLLLCVATILCLVFLGLSMKLLPIEYGFVRRHVRSMLGRHKQSEPGKIRA
jgi:O-antigen/teichoic acid export membrane protein